MTCPECRSPLTNACGTHHYTESGLPYVYLVGIPIARCRSCGERVVSILRIEELHRLVARTVAGKKSRLAPFEARFLRKFLGFSGRELAAHMGVTPETVSRWENAASPEPMSAPAERLLRVMVHLHSPADDYPMQRLSQISRGTPRPLGRLRIKRSGAGWRSEPATAA